MPEGAPPCRGAPRVAGLRSLRGSALRLHPTRLVRSSCAFGPLGPLGSLSCRITRLVRSSCAASPSAGGWEARPPTDPSARCEA